MFHTPYTKLFLKALFLVLFFSFFILLRSVLSSPTHQLNITPMHMAANCLFIFLLPISHMKTTIDTVSTCIYRTKRLSINQSKTAFLLSSLFRQLSKVSDAALAFQNQLLINLTRLVISVSYSALHSPCRIIFTLYLAFCLFAAFFESEILSILLL